MVNQITYRSDIIRNFKESKKSSIRNSLYLVLLSFCWVLGFLFIFSSSTCLAAANPVKDGKYRIESTSGEVLQDQNGVLVWSKWSAQRSQIWNVEYHTSSYLRPAGYNLSSEKNPGLYVYWDRGSKGDGKNVVIGSAQDAQYTINWNLEAKSSPNTFAIRNAHAPGPYLSNDVSSISSSNATSGTFKFNSDLTPPSTGSSSLVFTSDPQYPWTEKTDNGQPEDEKTKKARSEELIKKQYNDVNSYNNSTSNQTNIMINGDITAFGHAWQWDKMNSLMPLLNRQYYMGLGNHDIENNQGDSYQDNCFKRSIEELIRFKNQNNIPRNNISNISGCQSYAVELPGNLFALQLNNDPTMDYTPTWGGTPAIVPNFDWIEGQLKYAHDNGYNIIVNIHKPNAWKNGPSERFRNMLKKYDVKAVFAGHYHYDLGQQFYSKNYFGDIPVYLSGSSSQKQYLITEYTDKKMDIYTVKNDDWRSTKTKTNTIYFDR